MLSSSWTHSKSTGRDTCLWDLLPNDLKSIIKQQDGFEIVVDDYHYKYRDSFGGEGLVFRWKEELQGKSKGWQCISCGKTEPSLPFKCTYCKQNFCSKHRLAEMHDCIETRYVKYIRKNWLRKYGQNITTGAYYVVCDQCGFESDYAMIEIAGDMLQQHVKDKGCNIENVFLQGGD